MILAKVFRSSHTVRITLPPAVRHALDLSPGQRVLFDHTAPGIVTMRNADALITAARSTTPRR